VITKLEKHTFADFVSTMCNFQSGEYTKALNELNGTDPIIQKTKSGGADFREAAFANLTKA